MIGTPWCSTSWSWSTQKELPSAGLILKSKAQPWETEDQVRVPLLSFWHPYVFTFTYFQLHFYISWHFLKSTYFHLQVNFYQKYIFSPPSKFLPKVHIFTTKYIFSTQVYIFASKYTFSPQVHIFTSKYMWEPEFSPQISLATAVPVSTCHNVLTWGKKLQFWKYLNINFRRCCKNMNLFFFQCQISNLPICVDCCICTLGDTKVRYWRMCVR